MHISFGPNTDEVSLAAAFSAVRDWRIEGEWTNDGYPTDCFIVEAGTNGLTICEPTTTGRPQRKLTWLVPWDEVVSVTVI